MKRPYELIHFYTWRLLVHQHKVPDEGTPEYNITMKILSIHPLPKIYTPFCFYTFTTLILYLYQRFHNKFSWKVNIYTSHLVLILNIAANK